MSPVWCTGFREIRWVQRERIGKGALPPRERVVIELGVAALARTLVGRAMVCLPEHRGAGPCGTRTAMPATTVTSPLDWSMTQLLAPLQQWYANRPQTRQLVNPGPKHGGGNGQRVIT